MSPAEVTALYTTGAPPVAYWKFDETSGQTVNDSSGNNNHGTLGSTSSTDSADPVFIAGKYGNALNFDGINDYIALSAVTPKLNYTLSAWVYPTKAQNSSAYGNMIFNWGVLSGCGPSSQSFYIKSNMLNYYVGCLHVVNTPVNTIDNNNWYHVSLTTNSTGNVVIYINGNLSTGPAWGGGSDANLSTGNDKIGASHAGGSLTAYFKGKIDDVKVYNYARSQEQILKDMNYY